LDFAFECESERLVLVDRQRMRQAITNLLDNAFAYTPPGGSISVHQRTTTTGLAILVRDSGPGLTESDMEKIWKRFERGSAGRGRDGSTGLGLPLVRAVAQAHYGDAGCRNRPEGGSEFWIWIPLSPHTDEARELQRRGDLRDFVMNATITASPQIAAEKATKG
jgi:signal transduction histidine kinase